MSSTLQKLPFILPLTLLFAGASWAQTSAISGDVKGEDGKPLQGAMIKIDRKDQKVKKPYEVKTDKKGHYYYGGLGAGTYQVSVEVNGQVKESFDGVQTKLGGTAEVPFDLQKAAAEQAAAAGAAAGGGVAPPPEANREKSAAEKAADEKKRQEQEAQLAKNKALNDAFNEGKDAAAAKQWDAAVAGFEKAIALDQTKDVVWANAADAYANLAGVKTGAEQQAANEKAIAAYKKAIELKPDDAAYHNNYALVLAKAKNMTEAQAELDKAAQLDRPNAGKYYYNLGALLVNTGQTEPAVAAFKKALEQNPNYADAHYQLGISLMGQATTKDGKLVGPPGTSEAFQKYLELQPNGPFADSAKAMLESMGTSVETNFNKKQAPKKK
jgi:tetratricopeptide (TPR) repeat protein